MMEMLSKIGLERIEVVGRGEEEEHGRHEFRICLYVYV